MSSKSPRLPAPEARRQPTLASHAPIHRRHLPDQAHSRRRQEPLPGGTPQIAERPADHPDFSTQLAADEEAAGAAQIDGQEAGMVAGGAQDAAEQAGAEQKGVGA